MQTEHGLEGLSSNSDAQATQATNDTDLASEPVPSLVEQPTWHTGSWDTGSFVIDLQADSFCYVDINLAAANLLGLEADQILGKPFDQVLPSDQAALIRQNCQSCINRGVSLAYEQQISIEDELTWGLTNNKSSQS